MSTHFTQGLRIIKKNGLCSIQDLGRMPSQHLGFSASGAADEYAFLFANHLLTNNKNSAALEITLGQLTCRAEQNCTIAITGADCAASINNTPIKNWQAYQLQVEDVITFSLPKQGLHSYLAIAGGFQTEQWLNSRSQTLTETSLGFNGNEIVEGCTIPIVEQPICDIKTTKLTPSNFYTAPNTLLALRFIPQKAFLIMSKVQQKKLCDHTFTITPNINRMGYRLSSLPSGLLTNKNNVTSTVESTLSKPVTYGTIQLPSNHQPIVLMKERQTIGGYPVLGCVIQTDLHKLSQLRPGNKVKFVATTLPFAQQQLNAMHQKFT